jgi:hypothetical protein
MGRGFPDLPFLTEEQIVGALRGNNALVTTHFAGDAKAIRQLRTFQELMVPSVGIQRIDSDELEIEGLVLIQFHFFHRNLSELRTLRNDVLRLVHSDYHFTIGGLEMYSLYSGGRRHDDPTASSVYISDDIEYHPYRVTETA